MTGIHHAAIVVPDLDRAIDFYQQALALALVKRSAWQDSEPFDRLTGLHGSAAHFCLMRADNCYVEIFCYDSSRDDNPEQAMADRLGLRHLAFEVKELDKVLAKFIARGGEQLGDLIRVKGGGAAVYCRDPFGNIVELVEPAATFPGLEELG